MRNYELRAVYATKALSQLPRILGNMDRNPYSPTYGCLHRDYWLDKTSDFPDAVRQFAVHAMALAYINEFPENIYKGKKKMLDWSVQAMLFWASIQHKDGSFDEFYPYERGWVGPSAFTTYTIVEAYALLRGEMTEEQKAIILKAIKKAAYFIGKGENEEDHLANHHAMACLSLWKCYEVLNDPQIKNDFENAFQVFLTYHNNEGWSREYDGVDPGYLSATVSFFSKVYKTNPDERIKNVIDEAVAFSSYFAYPNGFYAGSLGSRNTLHFYCHGYEVMASKNPLAAAIAEKMLTGLSEDKLVPPEIISDRYLVYRVPEFLLSYLDYANDPKTDKLPYEKPPFQKFFLNAGIFIKQTESYYSVSNLAKGGVIKIFDKNNRLVYNNCGIIGKTAEGEIITSQWIDPTYTITTTENSWKVEGRMNKVPSNKLFTPLKNIVFRLILILLGWNPYLAHQIKGKIRKVLILGQRKINVSFTREIDFKTLELKDTIKSSGVRISAMSFGDEFFVRYVPQSRYFQSQELEVQGYDCSKEELERLNKVGSLIRNESIKFNNHS